MARKNKNGSRLLVPPRSEKMRNAQRSRRPRRPTVIAGHRRADDFAVIWRAMSIGRIRKATGAPHEAALVVELSPARQAAG
jgi:hypothetical protein